MSILGGAEADHPAAVLGVAIRGRAGGREFDTHEVTRNADKSGRDTGLAVNTEEQVGEPHSAQEAVGALSWTMLPTATISRGALAAIGSLTWLWTSKMAPAKT